MIIILIIRMGSYSSSRIISDARGRESRGLYFSSRIISDSYDLLKGVIFYIMQDNQLCT